jgi:hypothetical protein
MSHRIVPFVLLAALAGCGPSGTTSIQGPASTAPSTATLPSTPAILPSAAAGLPGASTYTKGTMKVDGAAATLPTAMYTSKQEANGAVTHLYGIGIPADAKPNEWFLTITYGVQGAAHNIIASLVLKTGDAAQNIQTFSYTRLDSGTGAATSLPAGTTGAYKEHDGLVDISFSGDLTGLPKATRKFEVNLPDLPL